jgi:hypothetical protein
MSKKLSRKMMSQELKRMAPMVEEIVTALTEDHPRPVCGLKECAYRIGWAKSERNHELRRIEEQSFNSTQRLERMAAFCDSVPAFARSVLKFRIGDGSASSRTLEQTAEAFGLSREGVRQIIDSGISIVAEIDRFAKVQADTIKMAEKRIEHANQAAAEIVALEVSLQVLREAAEGGSK